ncbi:hypothetical protein [Treponema pectinovorum]|uniref:hypothetical protein n=1 Tax=Treponema pectinovorum TaxID=164 RepID=UPI0011C81C09|nr:hypothetical protein [Treponema pectinovorum]
MKKSWISISFFCIFALSAILISSCVISESQGEDLPEPTVAESTSDFTISFPSIAKMKYANIIRLSSSTANFENPTKTNIGQVIPNDLENLASTYQFVDSHTATGVFYKYLIRYYNGSVYKYTLPNNKVLEGLSTSEANLPSSITADCTINEATGTYTIKLSSAVTLPANFSLLSVLVSNGTNERPFNLATAAQAATNTAAVIDLQKELSQEFLDCKIKFTGVCAISPRVVSTGSHPYKYYYWTNKATVTTTINYTDKNGDVQAVDPNSAVIIPSSSHPENEFDFSSRSLNF